MTIKRKPYNTYTKEFKLEALRLMEDSDSLASICFSWIAATLSFPNTVSSRRMGLRIKPRLI